MGLPAMGCKAAHLQRSINRMHFPDGKKIAEQMPFPKVRSYMGKATWPAMKSTSRINPSCDSSR